MLSRPATANLKSDLLSRQGGLKPECRWSRFPMIYSWLIADRLRCLLMLVLSFILLYCLFCAAVVNDSRVKFRQLTDNNLLINLRLRFQVNKLTAIAADNIVVWCFKFFIFGILAIGASLVFRGFVLMFLCCRILQCVLDIFGLCERRFAVVC
ncbi:MAG: hypothetical protein LBT09_04325 [Planctomycetaceae bacterium]|jgi:hypothetical protein|nr:hypothetical protein [Planctomycetaceae bacterium]